MSRMAGGDERYDNSDRLERSLGHGGVPYTRRWLAALVMVGAVLMDTIDITIVNAPR